MFKVLAALCAACILVGCSRESAQHTVALAGSAAATPPSVPRSQDAHSPRKTLAYEHHVFIELPKDLLPKKIQAVQTACRASTSFTCTLLDISFNEDKGVSGGRLAMRLAPEGVAEIIEVASDGGKVSSRTTHAEDLAEPVADTERQLAQLSTHRDRLMDLMKNKRITLDQLITVSRELGTVQSEIDSLSGRKANLDRRIDTELLTLDFSMPPAALLAERSVVKDALRDFGSQFRDALADVIRVIAVLTPWSMVMLIGFFLFRLVWRGVRRLLARRRMALEPA
jgi:hypothetical protein